MKKKIVIILLALMMLVLCGCGGAESMPVKLLIVPHFEIDEMSGDFPGEAQLFYEEYLNGCDVYETASGTTVYYNPKNGVAMYMTGVGKVNSAMTMTSVLSDERFDFSQAYILSPGCAGGAKGYSIFGDVVLITAACDYDLGHTVDGQTAGTPESGAVWFHDSDFDHIGCKVLNESLMDQVYTLTKDIELDTTDIAVRTLERNFPGEEWTQRDAKVLRGTTITSDNYWKGEQEHERAAQIVDFYQVPDPYAITEMEDLAGACAAEHFGMLDRLIILRCNVNADVFLNEDTPQSLWGDRADYYSTVSDDNAETLDIFEPAMRNTFKVGKVIADAILNGELK